MESTDSESKRACIKVENDAVCMAGGRWDELSPEILASIFVRIVPPDLMVRSVALVCRNWMETVSGPYCWTEIDLEEWCRKCCIANRSHLIDPVVRKVVRRSRSTFRRLSTYRLGDVGFSFAANRSNPMAKKKSWFNLLKRIFVSESESRLEKGKRNRWVFTRLKIRRLVASSALSPPRERRQHQKAEEKPNKHDIDVETIAESNADAETPKVEAEIATCKDGNESIDEAKNETVVLSKLNLHVQETQYFYLYKRRIENLAAIKIQTAFRGYLARKALRALKALVRLQAIVRGRAVRRQAIATLKSLQSIVNIQSEVCAKRCDQVKTTVHCQENTHVDLGEKDIKTDLNSQKRWDNRLLSKEEANKMSSSKREAAIKRERIREYWLSHRRSTESEVNGRRRYWLEQWVDAQLAKKDGLIINTDTIFSSRNKEEFERKEMKSRPSLRQYHTDQELVSPVYVPRRSFHHRRQKSSGDHDNTFMGSPSIPTYMAATESAKAKARSMSSPRLRPINTDVYSEINSPYKYKLSPISSINSDATVTSRIGSVTGFSQRSPCLKGTPGPIKSNRGIKDLNFGSDGAFANWDRIGACR